MRYRWIGNGVALLAAMLAGSTPVRAEQTVGLFLNHEDSFDGYTLFNQLNSDTAHLIDNAGKLVRSWQSSYSPGFTVYLLDARYVRRRTTGFGSAVLYLDRERVRLAE